MDQRMEYRGPEEFLRREKAALAGPVAVVFAEDAAEVAGTLAHLARAGFRTRLLVAPATLTLPSVEGVPVIRHDLSAPGAVEAALNPLIAAAPGVWFHWCYNAEYLFHPFSETRNVRELIAFHAEERRQAMLTYVIDLYAGDLSATPDAVSVGNAWLDRTGYYALGRTDGDGAPLERQLDIYGGLRWRFEEHVPWERRRIDRIGLFQAQKGLELLPGAVFNIAEYNTYACAWHHNLTAAICSFRTAKALKQNPASSAAIGSFLWENSVRFNWSSQQLLDLGLMEPGQWF